MKAITIPVLVSHAQVYDSPAQHNEPSLDRTGLHEGRQVALRALRRLCRGRRCWLVSVLLGAIRLTERPFLFIQEPMAMMWYGGFKTFRNRYKFTPP